MEPRFIEKCGDLIIPVRGKIEEIIGINSLALLTPMRERVMGGSSQIYEAGFTTRLEMEIKNQDSNNLVKYLIFNGNSEISEGDEITSYIFAGEEKGYEFVEVRPHKSIPMSKYVKRELNEIEEALYIDILKNGRRDYGVNCPEAFIQHLIPEN